ncbi:MAG: hypothetical protein WED33_06165 [Bacteroidia bacterium]
MRYILYASISLLFILNSCKKETVFVYEVDPVTSRKDDINKGIPKSTVEFISIAYSDVFGNTISQNNLSRLTLLYLAFGDKRLIEDLLVKNMLNSPNVSLMSNSQMRSDIPGFVQTIYSRLFNREPNELEAFSLEKSIIDDTELTPELIYYSMMTSDEYRYY